MTRRVPQRSVSPPTTGHARAFSNVLKKSADDRAPRAIPRSAVTGFRKIPKAKMLIAPEPTKSPHADANTTHQRFEKMFRNRRALLREVEDPLRVLVCDLGAVALADWCVS